MTLQRLVLEFRGGELVVRCLYRTPNSEATNGAKTRRREVAQLAREGLHSALEALEEDAELVGTSGFTQREDVLLATASPDTDKLVKGA